MGIAASKPAASEAQRQAAMRLFARASRADLEAALSASPACADARRVRGPETGLVMVKGRIGGGGAAFNLGETTVSRAPVRLASGTIGHGHVLGTDREKARLAAIADALWQEGAAEALSILETVGRRLAEEDAKKAAEVAATRVDFFTLVRGED